MSLLSNVVVSLVVLEVSALDPLTGQAGLAVTQNFAIAPKLIADGAAPDMDGVCGDLAYLADKHPVPLRFDDGTEAQVYMLRAGEHIYLCYAGLKFMGDATVSGAFVAFDRNGDGGGMLMDDNLLLAALFDESTIFQEGPGDFDNAAGFFALSSITGDVGSIEFKIDEALLDNQGNGWNRPIGMLLGQFGNSGENTVLPGRWPRTGDFDVPDTYGVLALGLRGQSIDFPPLPGVVSGGDVISLEATATSGARAVYFCYTRYLRSVRRESFAVAGSGCLSGNGQSAWECCLSFGANRSAHNLCDVTRLRDRG